MASSSADCVLGGVRLISSASTMWLKTGPGTKTRCRRPVCGSSWMMSVPVMSEGMRSGVNWMRENLRSSTWARVCTIRVLARPGTPVMMLLPPTKSEISTCSMMSSWPTMSLRSSRRMRSRPCFMRSASSTSSEPAGSISMRSVVMGLLAVSVCHAVDDVVDAQLVGLVAEVDGRVVGVRPFPVLAHILVVVRDDHESLAGVVVLEDADVVRPRPAEVRVREGARVVDPEEGVEDRMIVVDVEKAAARQHLLHLLREVRPVRPHEVVEDEEAALEQVGAQSGRLLVGQGPEARLAHVGHGVLEELGIVEGQDVAALLVRIERGQLLEHLHEVGLAARIVVVPLQVEAPLI